MRQYQKKHSPAHTYADHQSSFIYFLHPLRSIASFRSIYVPDSLFAQPHSKSYLVYLLVWNPTSYSIRFSPNHCLLFATHAHTIATSFAVVLRLCRLIQRAINGCSSSSNPSLFLNSYLELFYLNVTHPSDHCHLSLLKCNFIFLFLQASLTSMQYTTLHTTAVHSPSPYQ